MEDALWIDRCANQLRRRWLSLDAAEAVSIATRLAGDRSRQPGPELAANGYVARTEEERFVAPSAFSIRLIASGATAEQRTRAAVAAEKVFKVAAITPLAAEKAWLSRAGGIRHSPTDPDTRQLAADVWDQATRSAIDAAASDDGTPLAEGAYLELEWVEAKRLDLPWPISDAQWKDLCATELGRYWSRMDPTFLANGAATLAEKPAWRAAAPETAAVEYVYYEEAKRRVEPSAFVLTVRGEGLVAAEKERALSAAEAVFARAGVTPMAAALAQHELERWDDAGFPDDEPPLAEHLVSAGGVWLDAGRAASDAIRERSPDDPSNLVEIELSRWDEVRDGRGVRPHFTQR